ncbi:hypothetical protein BJP34_24045 [Moorena producens PAL-8-15-08-1]|uniref:Uncharacterized protein n=1 Tax=Moorena producens PAL-8-15-08-1 TaxID=1458985 RepID=A0A1D8TWS0_9CYAN|nr:SitI3 family protein [Moorena producens]AOX02099.1 hypothetical protein BJP34_24045 [Moorena producens PAL-8-15-08-1]
MALDFDLEMVTELKPQQALNILATKLALEWQQDNLKAPGILINADVEDRWEQDVTEENFGFRPTLVVGFRINPNQDYEGGLRTLIRATISLLQQTVGEAVLLFNYETVVLQRLGNKLILNEEMLEPSIISEIDQFKLTYELQVFPCSA